MSVDDDDPGARDRVYGRIAPLILRYHDAHTGEAFHAEDLRQFVMLFVNGQVAPDSPGRILRELRLEGRLNYVVINRRDSLYQFRPVA